VGYCSLRKRLRGGKAFKKNEFCESIEKRNEVSERRLLRKHSNISCEAVGSRGDIQNYQGVTYSEMGALQFERAWNKLDEISSSSC
jgi:hypothetical protein